MTEPISIEKCKRCVRFRNNQCSLDDLEPCHFVPKKGMAGITVACLAALMSIPIIIPAVASCERKEPEKVERHWSTVDLLKELHKKEEPLTDFQMLTMAIALTESRFRPDAVGTAGDSGILQIRPIYVEEVNRVSGTSYSPEDAFDIGKSLEMFALMQEAKNPQMDIDTAIRYHNKSSAYMQKVLENMEVIRRYETIRAELTK